MSNIYRVCSRCIMDTTDPDIEFDENDVCNHCRRYDDMENRVAKAKDGKQALGKIVDQIKKEGIGAKYDCIMGLSGGIDSSYLACQAKKLGLRPLAVHVDAGWNSELAVKNIENIVKILEIDLYKYVVNWEEMQDLQVAFLRSGVVNIDIPQDHAFFAALYSYAVKSGIRYVLHGGNIATESILPRSWMGHSAMDKKYLMSIHKRFGKRKLRTFLTLSFYQHYVKYPLTKKKMRVIQLLNYMPYIKEEAKHVLVREFGWADYGNKHFESRFTKFHQGYYLPARFGYDKRKAHLSSLIVSGQLTREEALNEMEKELYPADELREDRLFIMKKLGLTEKEFDEILQIDNKTIIDDYPSYDAIIKCGSYFKNMIRKVLKKTQR